MSTLASGLPKAEDRARREADPPDAMVGSPAMGDRCESAPLTHLDDSPSDRLIPVLDARWVLQWRHLAVCLLLGGLFVYLNCLPLIDSSIWLHMYEGRQILECQALPEIDAAQPLTDGMPIVHTCWLSQATFAVADRLGGPNSASNLFALLMLVYLILLARVFYLQTHRVSMMLFGVVLALVVGARFRLFPNAEVFGQVCFATLLWLTMRTRTTRLGPLFAGWHALAKRGHVPAKHGDASDAMPPARGAWPLWLSVGALFAVWANLHGSFLLGIAVLLCYAAARAIEAGWRGRSLRAVLADRPARRWLLLAQWATLASFLNPYGPWLILENLALLGNEKVVGMPQWLALNISAPNGMVFLGSLVLLAVVLRHSRRRVRPIEVLLMAVFGASAVPTARALSWYAVVYAFVLVPHVADIWGRLWPVAADATAPAATPVRLSPKSFAVSLLCVLVVYGSFRWSPISGGLLDGTKRDLAQLVGSADLCRVAERLREHPSPGLVYAPIAWADYLVWQGAPDLRVLMTSNVERVPRRIWSDHARMSSGQEGWYKGMDRYGVETLVIDKENQAYLAQIAKRSTKYRTVYENDTAVVLERVEEKRRRATLAQSGTQPPERETPPS